MDGRSQVKNVMDPKAGKERMRKYCERKEQVTFETTLMRVRRRRVQDRKERKEVPSPYL